jgi:hypothetical protein
MNFSYTIQNATTSKEEKRYVIKVNPTFGCVCDLVDKTQGYGKSPSGYAIVI